MKHIKLFEQFVSEGIGWQIPGEEMKIRDYAHAYFFYLGSIDARQAQIKAIQEALKDAMKTKDQTLIQNVKDMIGKTETYIASDKKRVEDAKAVLDEYDVFNDLMNTKEAKDYFNKKMKLCSDAAYEYALAREQKKIADSVHGLYSDESSKLLKAESKASAEMGRCEQQASKVYYAAIDAVIEPWLVKRKQFYNDEAH